MKLIFFILIALVPFRLAFASQIDNDKPIEVTQPWARATFALAKTGALYFTLTNHSDKPITLLSAQVAKTVASKTEIHHTIMQDGMMKMQELAEGVLVGPGETVHFSPGGKHIMLMGLTGPLEDGEKLQLALEFNDDVSMSIDVPIRKQAESVSHEHH